MQPGSVSLRRQVLADFVPGASIRDVILVLAYPVAIGISAQLLIPLPSTPVPITGQTFAVLLGAMVLGRGRAAVGALLYLLLGTVGVPWFAVASGATFGYVIGFLFAATILGWLSQRGYDRRPQKTLLAMVLGNLVIYACGVPYLALTTGLTLVEAVAAGALPFIPGDLVKTLLATALLPAARTYLARRNHP